MAIGLVLALALAAVAGAAWRESQGRNLELRQQNSQLQTELSQALSQPAAPATSYKSTKGVSIEVYKPSNNAAVSSPLTIIGEVPGNWSFEAQFPVSLLDASGRELVKSPAKLIGDWTTTTLVPFSVTLDFKATAGTKGSLVLQKDNPSGLSSNDDRLIIPISFK